VAMDNSPDAPLPVRTVSHKIAEWVHRLGAVWLEGQITQISRRPGMRTAWVTLRDVEVDMSLSVVTDVAILDRVKPGITDGQRVIVHAKPEFYAGRGQLQMRAHEFRPVGRGALLEELERLRALFAAEGLFAVERKRPLPFVPRRIGLICGRASAAMHDVVVNTGKRWPLAEFEIREVAVQGASAVTEIVEALEDLNTISSVDVIVLARGGGSVEDLLPFSNERLVRAVVASRVPVVSAIGHEQDAPLVDFVADLRASTPTDAAKRIVPDLDEQWDIVTGLHLRGRSAVLRRITVEQQRIQTALQRVRTHARHRIDTERRTVDHLVTQVRTLSPLATLQRGYAVVQSIDTGQLIRDADDVKTGERLRIRVAIGRFTVERVHNPANNSPDEGDSQT
jgi:exodeoxyribonuclease VII large subunit